MRPHGSSTRLLIRSWAKATLTQAEYDALQARAAELGVRGGCLSEKGARGPWGVTVYSRTLRAQAVAGTVTEAFRLAFEAYEAQRYTADELAAIARQTEAVS